ncbi:tRNA (adenosine(37)-N6)-dimethylallyltransferase MiaA [Salirhabdus salicampi]|uniref:tRNA (adenosine(37)-N6)-dimethylallyltransferase MiaA n=1 Tax=Salirhabdus salicampi TaxID=476102 RepID=UPI0020C32BE8|nr:tRNA (adenosine(37)-N6)-dimethylallyltransferase MiaA [Salirhabdus salicampi]MCP8616438.1 tRNA (adenosine(37)-N6)-dimethylallyltransferase MiaA [Salirhabdus salicampi]
MKIPVVAVVGPTAVGKTKLSIEIAKRFHGEVISGDSMQIYKGLDIGTAKVKPEEMEGIPHYMIDILEPSESFSVASFQLMVQNYIKDINERDKLPIIAGGTGLYIQSVLYDFQFSEEKRDESFTEKLEEELEEKGIDHIHRRLAKVDPEQARKIHPNNVRRVIRALEIYEKTGMTMSELHEHQKQNSPYTPILIGLQMEREELYNRINRRVDSMMEEGLLQEVERLYDQGLHNVQSMQGIGYKEFIPYFEGKIPLQEAVDTLKRNSRRYAKRQYTYFRNKMNIHWYPISEQTAHKTFSTILQDLEGLLGKITKY